MENEASLIQWSSGTDDDLNGNTVNTLAVSNGSAVDSIVELALTNPDNDLIFDDAAQDYTIDVTPSGAAANKFIDLGAGAGFVAWAGAVTLTLKDGKASFTIRADYASNTLVATLSAASGSKTFDGTLTITGS